MRKTSLTATALPLLLLLAASSCRTAGHTASTVTVTTTADSGPGSLRDAVKKAADGGTVTFAIPKHDAGYDAASGKWTIRLTGGEISFLYPLAIKGGGRIILDGNGASRILNHGGDGILTLDGLAFRNGNAGGYGVDCHGGAVYTRGSATAVGCVFSNNVAEASGAVRANGCGGAVYAYVSVIATDCAFADNAADAGGAVNANVSVTLRDCALTHNKATFSGGAAHAESGPVTATGCVFSFNIARNSGGGAVFADKGSVTIADCMFDGNTATYGGAAYAKGDITATDCAFLGNKGELSGGAVYAINNITLTGFTVTATGCTFSGNTSRTGGAVCARHAVIAGCVFIGNAASYGGGAVFAHGDAIAVNTVFTGNRITGSEHAGVVQAVDNAYLYHTTVADGTGTGVYVSSLDPSNARLYAYNSIIAGNSAAVQVGHGVRGKSTEAFTSEGVSGASLIEGITDGITRAAVFGENGADENGVTAPLAGGIADKTAAALTTPGVAIPANKAAPDVIAALRKDITGAPRPATGKVSYGAKE